MKLLAPSLSILVLALAALLYWLYTPDISRARLEAKYHVRPGDTVAAAGLRLHISDTGPRNAPVVILLHGFGSSLQTFDAWAPRLSAHYRVIRYDLPGFGLTGPDPTKDYSEARGMAVLAALMRQLGVARASLIGNSMGGKLAWQFAAQYPSLVAKLVLISPDGFASPGFEYGKAPAVPLLVRALPYTLPTALLRMSLRPAYADPRRMTDALVTRYRDMMLAPGVRRAILLRTAQTILRDPVPLLRQIKAPTLIVWGEMDGMIPVSNAQDYVRDIPGATLVTLPGVGHVPQEEAPDLALSPISTFLAQ